MRSIERLLTILVGLLLGFVVVINLVDRLAPDMLKILFNKKNFMDYATATFDEGYRIPRVGSFQVINNLFLRTPIKEWFGLGMPVVYDPEHILEDEARTDGVTGEQFTQNAKVFCKEIEKAGYDAMIYSNMLWEAYELDLEKLLDYPVWYADYEELPQTPYRFSMWQYSSTGSVPGIEGNVDLNIQLLKK